MASPIVFTIPLASAPMGVFGQFRGGLDNESSNGDPSSLSGGDRDGSSRDSGDHGSLFGDDDDRSLEDHESLFGDDNDESPGDNENNGFPAVSNNLASLTGRHGANDKLFGDDDDEAPFGDDGNYNAIFGTADLNGFTAHSGKNTAGCEPNSIFPGAQNNYGADATQAATSRSHSSSISASSVSSGSYAAFLSHLPGAPTAAVSLPGSPPCQDGPSSGACMVMSQPPSDSPPPVPSDEDASMQALMDAVFEEEFPLLQDRDPLIDHRDGAQNGPGAAPTPGPQPLPESQASFPGPAPPMAQPPYGHAGSTMDVDQSDVCQNCSNLAQLALQPSDDQAYHTAYATAEHDLLSRSARTGNRSFTCPHMGRYGIPLEELELCKGRREPATRQGIRLPRRSDLDETHLGVLVPYLKFGHGTKKANFDRLELPEDLRKPFGGEVKGYITAQTQVHLLREESYAKSPVGRLALLAGTYHLLKTEGLGPRYFGNDAPSMHQLRKHSWPEDSTVLIYNVALFMYKWIELEKSRLTAASKRALVQDAMERLRSSSLRNTPSSDSTLGSQQTPIVIPDDDADAAVTTDQSLSPFGSHPYTFTAANSAQSQYPQNSNGLAMFPPLSFPQAAPHQGAAATNSIQYRHPQDSNGLAMSPPLRFPQAVPCQGATATNSTQYQRPQNLGGLAMSRPILRSASAFPAQGAATADPTQYRHPHQANGHPVSPPLLPFASVIPAKRSATASPGPVI